MRRICYAPAHNDGHERGSLLFLNGRADMLEKYIETLEGWSAKGWAVTGFDWRGQGGSGRLSGHPLLGHVDDFAVWIHDLTAVVADWQAQNPPPHVIVGHSMGGHLLLRALAEGRVACDAAVLVAPMLGLNVKWLPASVGLAIADFMCAITLSRRPVWPHEDLSQVMMALKQGRLTHSDQRFAGEMAVRWEHPELCVGAPSWGWLRAAYRSTRQLEAGPQIDTLTTPMLILATSADRLVSPRAIARFARRLPNARLHFYGKESAHELLREVDNVRDDALARIDAFLDEAAPPRP
ncbi:MAG: alpha/beta hydrolase [Sphingobium sp.]